MNHKTTATNQSMDEGNEQGARNLIGDNTMRRMSRKRSLEQNSSATECMTARESEAALMFPQRYRGAESTLLLRQQHNYSDLHLNKRFRSLEHWEYRCVWPHLSHYVFDVPGCGQEPGPAAHYVVKEVATLHLLALLRRKLEEDPLALVSRTFDLLSATECDVTLRVYCYQTLRMILPLLQGCCIRKYKHDEATNAVNSILSCMQRHISSISVQIEAAKLLQRIFTENIEEADEDKPYTKRSLRVLLNSVQVHAEDVHFQCLAFDLVRRLRNSSSKHVDWLDAASVVIQGMTLHPTVAYIQQIGISLVAWLAEDSDSREIIIQAEGAHIIPAIMGFHQADPFIQCNAAAALCYLVRAGGRQGRCELDTQYIPIVLDVFKLHRDNPSAFGNCLCLLCGLTHIPETEKVMDIVLEGMRKHFYSARVQEGCLRWLRFRDPLEFEDVFQEAIPTILKAIRLHPDDIHMQGQAADVLTVVAGIETLRDCLLEHGAVDVVLDMLKHHRGDRRLQDRAIWFLTLAIPVTPSTLAFGGGFDVLETIWQSLGGEE